jgi:hypothetical protein
MYNHGVGMKRQIYIVQLESVPFSKNRFRNCDSNKRIEQCHTVYIAGGKRLSEEPQLVLQLTQPLSAVVSLVANHLDAVRLEFSQQLANDPQHLS